MTEAIQTGSDNVYADLGYDQAKISKITRGQFRGVSEAKMLELIAKLGHDVKISIGKTKRNGQGKIDLQFA